MTTTPDSSLAKEIVTLIRAVIAEQGQWGEFGDDSEKLNEEIEAAMDRIDTLIIQRTGKAPEATQ